MAKAREAVLEAAGLEVVITNPDKVFFPRAGHTKLDLAKYYAAVAEGALRGIAGRPIVLKRYVDGAQGEPFFQKRAPESRPEWIETLELRFPSGRTAREVVVRDAAQLLWIVNLGCIDLNPHPVRADDLEHPDELRIDLDPVPGVGWDDVRGVALIVRDVLAEHGLRGWPKTSGSRGMHVNVRLELSAAQEAAGLGDAPWPPHYRKQSDEPPRVAPSRRRSAEAKQRGSGRRSTQPLVTVAKAEHREEALAGLERWKARHPRAAALLEVEDVLVDSMRGHSSTWTRIRVNLRHVPEGQRPAEEPPDPDYDPWRRPALGPRRSRAPKTRSSS
ncbi:MAG: DNA polymerase domain-containing protein [Thermoanaerobaculia bacterium]